MVLSLNSLIFIFEKVRIVFQKTEKQNKSTFLSLMVNCFASNQDKSPELCFVVIFPLFFVMIVRTSITGHVVIITVHR